MALNPIFTRARPNSSSPPLPAFVASLREKDMLLSAKAAGTREFNARGA
jgi:hypothetical protein